MVDIKSKMSYYISIVRNKETLCTKVTQEKLFDNSWGVNAGRKHLADKP